MKKLLSSILLAACTLSALPVSASTITIDFEHTPGIDGILGTADDVPMPTNFLQSLSTQFSSMGLTFTQGSLLQDSFYNGDPLNHFISSTNPIAKLSKGATSIRIDSYSFWDATLTAFDIDGNAIASDRLLHPMEGANFFRGQLFLTSARLIYGFAVLPDNADRILNLDNLVLSDDVVNDVPEPPATLLFALGLALAGLALRARARGRG